MLAKPGRLRIMKPRLGLPESLRRAVSNFAGASGPAGSLLAGLKTKGKDEKVH